MKTITEELVENINRISHKIKLANKPQKPECHGDKPPMGPPPKGKPMHERILVLLSKVESIEKPQLEMILGIPHSMNDRILKDLVEKNYVAMNGKGKDAILSITEEGKTKLQQDEEAKKTNEAAVFDALTDDEKALVVSILNKIQ
ncbi:MAG: hypothetical protein LUG12_09165 [Erysipelotrichaceae bacterium]|nr:hypothetical protein [Erysipelotrichaceae bacterium]